MSQEGPDRTPPRGGEEAGLKFRLGPGQPAIFLAPQRGGKSNLIAFLLQHVNSWVVLDSSQHPAEWGKWAPAHAAVVSDDPDDILRHRRVVHQVSMLDLLDSSEWKDPDHPWTRALRNLMRRGNTVAVFDEAAHTLPAAHPHRVAIQIYTQGAKWGITPWACSQFANRIETATVRAAVHCFCFRMNPYDLRLLAEKRGVDGAPLAGLPDYGFGYHLTNTPAWELCPPVDRVM